MTISKDIKNLIITNYNIKIHVISTSASEESKSRQCLPFLINSLKKIGVKITQSDIRDFTPIWVDDKELKEIPKEYYKLYSTVKKVDGVILAFPVYNYTISSAAKAISEIIADALEDKPVGFLVAAGSIRSHLVVAEFMKSMMFEQNTLCYPKFVMVTKEDLIDNKLSQELTKRIEEFAQGFAQFTKKNI